MKNDAQQTSSSKYQIIVQSHLDEQWSVWFDDLDLTHLEDGTTSLTGYITDQSALQGILAKIGKLNLTLISVRKLAENA